MQENHYEDKPCALPATAYAEEPLRTVCLLEAARPESLQAERVLVAGLRITRQCVVDICILCDAAAIRSRQLVSRNGLISPFPVQVDEMKCFIFHQLWGTRRCGAIPGRSDFHWRVAASIMGSSTCNLWAAASPAKRRHRYLWAPAHHV